MNQPLASIHVATFHIAAPGSSAAAIKADVEPGQGVPADFSAILAAQLGVPGGLPQDVQKPRVSEDEPDTAEDAASPGVPAAVLIASTPTMTDVPVTAAAVVSGPEIARSATIPVPDGKQEALDVRSKASWETAPMPVKLAEVISVAPVDLAAPDVPPAAAPFATETDLVHDAEPATQDATPSVPSLAGPPSVKGAEPVTRGDERVPFHRAMLGEEVANRVTWMAMHGKQEAQIRLDPPHLGPLEMRLSISGDQATLSLISAHAAVRDALQNSVPRLYEMMQTAGVNLGQVHVGSESMSQPNDGQRHSGRDGSAGMTNEDTVDSAGQAVGYPAPTVRLGLGMVDIFA